MKTFDYGERKATNVLLQPVDEHDLSLIEQEVAFIGSNTNENFHVTAFLVDDWNRDLSPWQAPAVFGKEDFGDGARQTLQEILKYCEEDSRKYYIGGYSLAGLFSLWAVCQTDRFCGAAAASPSVWFPGFTDYLRDHRVQSKSVYLSLGNKEERSRNAVMAAVGDRIRETYEILRNQEIPCTLEWNEGNHFRDSELRTAKAFSWVLACR
ncbi:MAG: esterase [Bilifractor sp.]|jgi:hypothetical protein|nr:esterase [Lachnospiraceae bacterium]MDY2838593.1 esterase [Bilifractor sp.]